MIPAALAKQTITIVRPSFADDGHGNAEPDWSDTTEVDSPGWSVQPSSTNERLDHRDAVYAVLRAFGPPGADVRPTDRVRLSDGVYEVVGTPLRWSSPTGAVDHTELQLERWEG